MCHLKLSAVFLALSLVLLCVTATPGNRYVTSSGEQAELRLGRKDWFPAEFSRNRFLRSGGSLPQAGVTSHHIAKRRCNTATCVTQRLADFLVRSSNNVGPIYTHTNVGSNTYGKRDSLQPGNSENL